MLCLLRSRDAEVMKSILSCGDFICAQIHTKFLSYLFRQKSYTAKSALGVFSPIFATQGLKREVRAERQSVIREADRVQRCEWNERRERR